MAAFFIWVIAQQAGFAIGVPNRALVLFDSENVCLTLSIHKILQP